MPISKSLNALLLILFTGQVAFAKSNPASQAYVDSKVSDLKNELIVEIEKIPAGPIGPKGDKGDTGPQGIKGEIGLTGPQGLKGDTGATGAQGAKGDTGTTGAQGAKGDTGATGPQGAQGNTGAQGAKGDTGATGPQGAQGNTGAQGDKGDTGANGADGPGVPAGGEAGQILSKSDGIDFNTAWIDPANSGIRRQLGDKILGGTVIYVTDTGTHGLIAADTDQSTAIVWWDAQDAVTTAANYNTDGKSRTDWHLPTKNELTLIYAMRNELGTFNNDIYWSSTEKSSSNAWVQNIKTGAKTNISKNKTAGVRAVRSF